MSPSRLRRLQLLLLLFSLHRGTHGRDCPSPPPMSWSGQGEIMEPANALFDIEVCGPDGLQWTCYLRQECVHPTGGDPDRLDSRDAAAIKKYPCPAVFAIQARTENQWRVVMQAKNVPRGEKLVFKANCQDEFECWAATEGTTVKGRPRSDGFFERGYSEKRGRYDGTTLMCDFVISSVDKTKIEMLEDTTILKKEWHESQLGTPGTENHRLKLITVTKYSCHSFFNGHGDTNGQRTIYVHRFRSDAYYKLKEGCDLSMVRALPVTTVNDEVEYKPVNIDYHNFTCPATYSMRWRDTKREVHNTKPFKTTPGIFCTKGINGRKGVIKVIESSGADARSAQLDVHCARKKCKHCPAPNCTNSDACPQLIKFDDDFDTCPKLKCKDEQYQLRFGGKVHSREAVIKMCNNGKWTIGGDVVQEVDCFNATISCPNAREKIRTKNAEKFNFADDRVACKAETEDIKYTDRKDTGRMTAIVCNFSTGGQWYEERKDSEFDPEPYKDDTIDCYAPDSTAPATGNVLLYTAIGLVVVAVIIGVILVLCLMSRQRKKKAREAALKMAANGTKSKESKLLSPRSKSTMSRVTSTRSVTGNKKKKTGGKGGKTPDDNTPEERSRPVDRSSIVDTAELKKIEEERRKTAAATAALLESSKVEDEPQPVPATGAGSGEVPVEMIGKGSASLIPDATQQPEQPMDTPKLKTLQKKRLKKSKILENTDFTQQATVTVDKTQLPTASTQATHSMAVSKTQLGGPESDDEPETPMWHNQTAAAAAIPADNKVEPPAAADQKFADLPTAKKKDSTKKTKSAKKTPSAEAIVRPNYINDTSDWDKDFTSEKKKTGSNEEDGGGSKESEKDERSKRTLQRAWARKTSARIPVDPTQRMPQAAEENNN